MERYWSQVEWIIGLAIVLAGTYLCFAPWLGTNPTGVSSAVAKPFLVGYGIIYFLPGLSIVLGLVKKDILVKKWGLFFAYIFILFSQLLSAATHGIWPPTFISPLAVGLIAYVDWVRLRWI